MYRDPLTGPIFVRREHFTRQTANGSSRSRFVVCRANKSRQKITSVGTVCDKSAAHSLHANIMFSFCFPVVIDVNKWL